MKLPDRAFGIEFARFRPRLLDDLAGYDRHRFGADAGAGITVAIVALPLAMAFAIASGLKPEQGLFTAIIAGLLISLLGGSSVQIGGPAGAFIVIVYGIVERYGLANLLIATMLAGVLLFVLGWLKLGGLARYIPVAIVIGFTNGIAVLIALSQLKDLLGLTTPKLPADFFSQVGVLARHLDSFNPWALAIGALCFGGLMLWPRLWRRDAGTALPGAVLESGAGRVASRLPGPIVALVTLTLGALWLHLPVETIGSRFGAIPQSLPHFDFPEFTWATAKLLFIPTVTIALLGAIESLLCARIADNLGPQRRHDPNQELMAQGIANFVTPWFGGMPATGTIARTATNVRAGATSPVAGIVHALVLLAIVLVAAPLAVHVPLAALAGILLYAAWNMGEWHEFARLRHFSLSYRVILLGSFALTVIFDLTVAVEVGLVLACAFFIVRMSALFRVDPLPESPPGIAVRRLYGALFFGAVTKIEALADELPAGTRVLVLELHRLISLDASGLEALSQLHRTLHKRGIALLLCEVNEQPLEKLRRSGFAAGLGDANIAASLADALARAAPLADAADR